jgi:hypothetical protein
MTESAGLTGDDVVLIIEALDAFIAAGRNPAAHERQDYYDFKVLRSKLADGVGMNDNDSARYWLQSVLRIERDGFTAALTAKMFELLEDQGLTRRSLRENLVRAMQDCRDHQFYRRGALVSPGYHATNPPPKL